MPSIASVIETASVCVGARSRARRAASIFALQVDPYDPAQLRALLYANTRYCLAGDTAGYEKLGVDPDAMNRFQTKYEQVFVADYRWTEQNFFSMARRMGTRSRVWLDLIAPIQAPLPFAMPTIGDFVSSLQADGVDLGDLDALIDAIFERYFLPRPRYVL